MDKVNDVGHLPGLGGDHYPASYLGDGVYAIFDGCGIWLHANSHNEPTDRVYLEPEVYEALKRFVNDH